MRDDKYDLNHFKTDPWFPNQEDRRVIRMSWSMVSNAAERSRRQRQDSLCETMAFMDDDECSLQQSCFSGVVFTIVYNRLTGED